MIVKEIKDWKVIGNYGRGTFALEFSVSDFDEDEIRYLINDKVKEIQKRLQVEQEKSKGEGIVNA